MTFFRILLIIAIAWCIRQFIVIVFGKKRYSKSNRTPEKPKSSGGNMVKDPVCGMYMDPRLAVKHETANGIFYFCSEECKKKFLDSTSRKNAGTPVS
jgi:uncharacterized protein